MTAPFRTALAAAALACVISGCGGERGTVGCEATDRYAAATSAPPVRIPDDLSPPDETDSLRLPPESGSTTPPSRPCLESPPGFFAEGAPGGSRLGDSAPPAAGATPAPEPEPVDDPDRRIEN